MGMLVQNVEVVEDFTTGKCYCRIHLDIQLSEKECEQAKGHLKAKEAEPLKKMLKPKVHKLCRGLVDEALKTLPYAPIDDSRLTDLEGTPGEG